MSTEDTITTHDAELVLRLRRHDVSAIEEVLDRYAAYAYWFFLKATYEPMTAEDLRQELFVRIWRRAYQFNSQKATLSTWVMSIARNILIDRQRSVSERLSKLMDPIEELQRLRGSGLHLSSWAIDSAIEARNALESLPHQQKEILRMVYFDGYTHEEVARLVQLPLGTVKSNIRKGLIRLRHHGFASAAGQR